MMSEPRRSSNDSQVLDDVRRALGRKTTLRPTQLDPFVEERATPDSEEVVARFTSELIAVGGHVHRISDNLQSVAAVPDKPVPEPDNKQKVAGQVATRIAQICQAAAVAQGASEVALSKSLLIAEMELRDQLSARGLSAFVPETAGPSEHDQLVAWLAACGAGVTAVEYGIAETGTIVLCSDEGNGLLVSLLPIIHIALLRSRQISWSLSEVIDKLNVERVDGPRSYRSATMITGPSRTSDVELTLSIGVHGPKELHVIILD